MNLKLILFFLSVNIFILYYFKKISQFINIFDYPDSIRKFHKNRVALIGGHLILFNLIILFILNLIFKEYLLSDFLSKEKNIFFIISFFLLFILGTLDDKFSISANRKLIISFIIISTFLYLDNHSVLKEIRFSFLDKIIYLKDYSFFFTLLCVLLFINAFNMFDGINLQSGLYALIMLLYLLFINFNEKFYYILIISLFFFLFLNYKNKAFLGDAGTYLISFILSYCFIQNYNSSKILYADQIFFIMLFPGLDLLRLTILRIFHKRHPFSADRYHIHHLLLVRFGYGKTILIIFLITLSIAILSSNQLFNYLYIAAFSCIYVYLTSPIYISKK
jgi:UDP-N-acetylmuramyl pentapeptide phosphotransferase/UDP-N-acetylglucosamine-1-phosphate transferase